MHTHILLGSKWWHIESRLLLSEATMFHISFHFPPHKQSDICGKKQNLTTLLGTSPE